MIPELNDLNFPNKADGSSFFFGAECNAIRDAINKLNAGVRALAQGSSAPVVAVNPTHRTGASVPANSLGVDGDTYVNTANGYFYQRKAGVYVFIMPTRGSDGKSAYQLWLDAGNVGSPQTFLNSLNGRNGDNGADGDQWYNVAAQPQNTFGLDGDFAFQRISLRSYRIYHKQDGVWVLQVEVVETATANPIDSNPTPTTQPATAPVITYTSATRRLVAQHAQGGSIVYSYRGSVFVPYSGAIQVDSAAHDPGEWEFKRLASTGYLESPLSFSPAIAAMPVNSSSPHALMRIAGQSQAVGYAQQSQIPVGYEPPLNRIFSRVFIMNPFTGVFENLRMGVNSLSAPEPASSTAGWPSAPAGFGIEIALGQRWEEETTTGNLYLVKWAEGSTGIGMWAKGTPNFNELKRLNDLALSNLAAQGISPRQEADVWWQGETDEGTPSQTKEGYKAALLQMLNDWQEAGITTATSKRIIMQIRYQVDGRIRMAQAEAVATDPRMRLIDTINHIGNPDPDGIHCGAVSMLRTGGTDVFNVAFNKTGAMKPPASNETPATYRFDSAGVQQNIFFSEEDAAAISDIMTSGPWTMGFWATIQNGGDVLNLGCVKADGSGVIQIVCGRGATDNVMRHSVAVYGKTGGYMFSLKETQNPALTGRRRVVITYDGGTSNTSLQIWVDAQPGYAALHSTGAYTGPSQDGKFQIGLLPMQSDTAQSKNATMDCLFLADKVLNQSEVTTDFNGGNRTSMEGVPFASSIKLRLEMDGNLNDKSGNGYDGDAEIKNFIPG